MTELARAKRPSPTLHVVVEGATPTAAEQEVALAEQRHSAALVAHRVTVGYLLTTISSQAFIIEPALYWPGARRPVHDLVLTDEERGRLRNHPENRDTEAFVASYRSEMLELFADFGAAHLQIGRTYPWGATRDPATLALFVAIKDQLDPNGLMNPGSII